MLNLPLFINLPSYPVNKHVAFLVYVVRWILVNTGMDLPNIPPLVNLDG